MSAPQPVPDQVQTLGPQDEARLAVLLLAIQAHGVIDGGAMGTSTTSMLSGWSWKPEDATKILNQYRVIGVSEASAVPPSPASRLTPSPGLNLPFQGRLGPASPASDLGARASQGTPSPRPILVAFLAYQELPTALEVCAVGTHPNFRRKGLGAGLLAQLKAFAHARGDGAGELWLEVSAQNPAAIAVYLAQGFRVVGERPQYYPDGSSALVMSCP